MMVTVGLAAPSVMRFAPAVTRRVARHVMNAKGTHCRAGITA